MATNKIMNGKIQGALMMAAVLAAANYLVRFPLNDWLTWAAFCYPLIYLVTDCVNRFYGADPARKVVAAGFAIGLPMSFLFIYLDSGEIVLALRIAGASGGAYLVSQLCDVSVFDRLRRSARWWHPPLVSSAVASVIDALIFFSAAFAGTGLPWHTWMLGNLLAKAIMLAALLPPYRFIVKKFA